MSTNYLHNSLVIDILLRRKKKKNSKNEARQEPIPK